MRSQSLMSRLILAALCFVLLHTANVKARWAAKHNAPPPVYDWGCKDYDPATNSSVFAYLWCNSKDLADMAYQTPFIQGIKSGLLNPVNYSAFDIQDAWWLSKGSNSYGSVCIMHFCDEDQKDFFTRVSSVYLKYARSMMAAYNVPLSGVTSNAAAHAYARYESRVTYSYYAMYSVPLVTPCLYLWPALAQRLKAEGAVKPTNAYNFWIESNLGTGTTFAMAKALLDNETYAYNKKIALKVFRSAMYLEAEFFAATTTADPEATTQATV